jgi:hypothetical protein
MVENIETTVRQTSFTEYVSNGPETFWRTLGPFEHNRIASRKGESHCSNPQNIGSVP